MMNTGLNLGVGGGLRLGGGSSPSVSGSAIPGPPTAAEMAGFGTGSTTSDSGGYVGSTPGHLTAYAGIGALILLVLIRHSLSKG